MNRKTVKYNKLHKLFTCVFYKKSFKSLKLHCFMSTVYLTKNYELVILTTSVVESVGKFGVEKLDR